jgi:hypothetical protein
VESARYGRTRLGKIPTNQIATDNLASSELRRLRSRTLDEGEVRTTAYRGTPAINITSSRRVRCAYQFHFSFSFSVVVIDATRVLSGAPQARVVGRRRLTMNEKD